jgi:hypothetical protein
MKNSLAFLFIFILSFLAMNVFSQNIKEDSASRYRSIYVAEDAQKSVVNVSQIVVYPSYTFGNIYVDFGDVRENGCAFIVFDSKGEVMFKDNFFGNRVTLDLSPLNAGLYFIAIDRDGGIQTKKVVLLKGINF